MGAFDAGEVRYDNSIKNSFFILRLEQDRVLGAR